MVFERQKLVDLGATEKQLKNADSSQFGCDLYC